MNLATFLLDRIAEDEERARACRHDELSATTRADGSRNLDVAAYTADPSDPDRYVHDDPDEDRLSGSEGMAFPYAMHVLAHSPRRVLEHCASRRAIVELHQTLVQQAAGPDRLQLANLATTKLVLRHMAAPYADYDDFDPAWIV